MSSFLFAVNQLLAEEGGLSEDPNDEGGITNFGISYRFFKSIHPNATPDDIRNLKEVDAINIYQINFWNLSRWDEISSQVIANQALDMHVNMGMAPATKIIQRACCAVYEDHHTLLDDGIFGNKTLKVVNNSDVLLLSTAIKSERAGYYRDIVSRNPSHQSHLDGWLNRAYRV